jgi:tyrosinase
MDRYVSEPMQLPPLADPDLPITRTDLVFYDVDPLGPSYVAHVYLDAPDANIDTPREASSGYAGSFTIFGHGGCFGDDERHCAHHGPADPFDLRAPRGVPRQVKTVTVTDALRALDGDTVRVTVVPVVPSPDGPAPTDTLDFGQLRLLSYGS